MKLLGPEGDEFDLAVAGYQFPAIADDRYDSNWLVVEMAARIGGGSWKSRDPCLLTWELRWLIDWADDVAAGVHEEAEMSFLEPNIRFEAGTKAEDRIRLRVFFELESRPPWAKVEGVGVEDLSVALECTPADLRTWAAELRTQAVRFPVRAGVQADYC